MSFAAAARTGLVAATAMAGLGACAGRPAIGTPPPRTPLAVVPGVTPRDDEPAFRSAAGRGAEIYGLLCAECHGARGDGAGVGARVLRPAPTSFRDGAYMWRQRPSWYFGSVSRGIPGTAMPRWDHLLEASDRWDVAYYAWSLGDGVDAVAAGERVYARACSSCHGTSGNDELEAPLAVSARARYSRADVAAQLLERHEPGDVAIGNDELVQVVAYLSTFLYEPAPPATVPVLEE